MFDISTIILFCFAAPGMTSIIVEGAIFNGVRGFFTRAAERVRQRRGRNGWTVVETIYEVSNCYHCCGFWSGLFCGFLLITAPYHCTCENFICLFTEFSTRFGDNYWSDVFRDFISYLGALFCFAVAGSLLSLMVHFAIKFLFFRTSSFDRQMFENEQHNEQYDEQNSEETAMIRPMGEETDNK